MTIKQLKITIQLLTAQIQLLKLQLQLRDTKSEENRIRLYKSALSYIGTDASPNDIAPDEYGCAETVNEIFKNTFGVPIGGDVSTYRMNTAIRSHTMLSKTFNPLPGDIILSPTGSGNGIIKNGHVGIVGANGTIMSNDSYKGTWENNYTIDRWAERYQQKGGYPMDFYRVK